MAPCLSKLPSVCLETIFKHVPLVDLFYSVGLVCTSWYRSRRTDLMRRKRLVLIYGDYKKETLKHYLMDFYPYETELMDHVRRDDGFPWHTLESLDQLKFDALCIPSGMQTTRFISSLVIFSNVTRLHLNLGHFDSNPTAVIRLLYHFSENLVELKLLNHFKPSYNEDARYENEFAIQEHANNQANLFVCLDSLQSLKHLQLALVFVNISLIHPEHLSFLSRLTSFNFYDYGYGDGKWIYAPLNQYGQSIASIEVYNRVNVQSIPQIDNQLARKFTTLKITNANLFGHVERPYEALRQFCSRFSSLTKLELICYRISMTELARCLSMLSQLVHLELDLRINPIPPVERGQSEEGEQGEHAHQQIAQVPSVRLLILGFSTKSHHDTERLFISEIFPNLQILRLCQLFSECQDCGLDRRALSNHRYQEITEPELALRVVECTRLNRQPFLRCAKLLIIALGLRKEDWIIVDDEQ